MTIDPAHSDVGRRERSNQINREDAMEKSNLSWKNGYECRLGLTGNRTCVVSHDFAADQKYNDGKTTIALLPDGTRMRVRLIGDDYGLYTSGTGDMIVRPVRRLGR